MNEIDKKQVETRMLNLLRARTLIYRRAKNVQAVGLIISLVFPIVGLIVSALLLPSKPFIAFAALMFSFLEVLLLDRWHRTQLKNAAKLQEDFDCTVLQMDWNTFLVGNRIDPEDGLRPRSPCSCYSRRTPRAVVPPRLICCLRSVNT
jgi:hypothetical protein